MNEEMTRVITLLSNLKSQSNDKRIEAIHDKMWDAIDKQIVADILVALALTAARLTIANSRNFKGERPSIEDICTVIHVSSLQMYKSMEGEETHYDA